MVGFDDVVNKLKDVINATVETAGYLKTIKTSVTDAKKVIEDLNSKVGEIETYSKKYLPTMDTLSSHVEKVKSTLGTIDTGITSMNTVLNDAKTKLGTIEGYTKSIPTIDTNITQVNSRMLEVKNFLSDIKTKITDNLPKLAKLDKLNKLDDINTAIQNLQNQISSIDLTIPEGLEVNLDDSKIVEKLSDIESKFGNMEKRLESLGNIQFALEKQNNMIEYGINLLRTNIPLTQGFFGYFDKLNKLNTLGINALLFKLTPQEFFDKFNEIMTSALTFKFEIPEFMAPEGTLPEGVIGYKLEEDVLKKEELKGDVLKKEELEKKGPVEIIDIKKEELFGDIVGGKGIATDPAYNTGTLATGKTTLISTVGAYTNIKTP